MTLSQVINAGIHVVVAAGNGEYFRYAEFIPISSLIVDNTNASGTSPARVAAAITVGASTIADAHASFSNYR